MIIHGPSPLSCGERRRPFPATPTVAGCGRQVICCARPVRNRVPRSSRARRSIPTPLPSPCLNRVPRRTSEEHTSELQSLIRISYAFFCLTKLFFFFFFLLLLFFFLFFF